MSKMIAYCGLVCSDCPTFLATKNDDDIARQKTAELYTEKFGLNLKPEDINCDGCKSEEEKLIGYCLTCEIRRCCREKGLENCARCNDQPCEKLIQFHEFSNDAKASFESLKGKSTMDNETPNCAQCPYKVPDRLCRTEDGKAPGFCPTQNRSVLAEQSLKIYKNTPEICEFAKQAAIQEADGYINRNLGYEHVRASKTRIEEIMEFAGKMGYKRLGMAFCIGLRKEAKAVENIFSSKGFDMISVVCKAGRIPKEHVGVGKDQQIAPDTTEAMCNPILQAMILNEEKTDFNVLLGLCVGHDSLFFKYTEAPCTVLAVKDRLLGHNPLAAVYNVDSYYRCLK